MTQLKITLGEIYVRWAVGQVMPAILVWIDDKVVIHGAN